MLPEFGPEGFATIAGVSRETLARIHAYVGVLEEWNARHNLVSRTSLGDIWRRHVWDSAQLASLIPSSAMSLVDLGSGAGFPGLVLAILLRERPGFRIVLYEATRKKCRFLEVAALAAGVSVEIRCARIEQALPEKFDVVTARACAPLATLLEYASRFQGHRTLNLFLKGQNVDSELTEASKCWSMRLRRHVSRSDPSGAVLQIRELSRAG